MTLMLCYFLQGIIGNIPGQALAFLTLYLQLLGISDFYASLLVSLMMLAHALGGQLGGWLGDLAAHALPKAGRVIICQFSVAAGVSLCTSLQHYSCLMAVFICTEERVSKRN